MPIMPMHTGCWEFYKTEIKYLLLRLVQEGTSQHIVGCHTCCFLRWHRELLSRLAVLHEHDLVSHLPVQEHLVIPWPRVFDDARACVWIGLLSFPSPFSFFKKTMLLSMMPSSPMRSQVISAGASCREKALKQGLTTRNFVARRKRPLSL